MNVKMKHLSVDSETWGTRAGADIRSIGAFLFDPLDPVQQQRDDNTFYIACDNPLNGSYSADYSTPEDLDFLDGGLRQGV